MVLWRGGRASCHYDIPAMAMQGVQGDALPRPAQDDLRDQGCNPKAPYCQPEQQQGGGGAGGDGPGASGSSPASPRSHGRSGGR